MSIPENGEGSWVPQSQTAAFPSALYQPHAQMQHAQMPHAQMPHAQMSYGHIPYGWFLPLPAPAPKILTPNHPPQPQQMVVPRITSPPVHAYGLKKLPGVDWALAKLGTGAEYYYNFETNEATWDPPDDVRELVEQILEQSRIESELAKEGSILEKQDSALQAKIEGPTNIEQDSEDGSPGNQEAESAPSPEKLAQGFMDLLREYEISPYSMWDIEIKKISHDPRFSDMSESAARDVFEKYCRTRAAELRKKGARDISKEVAGAFKSLLDTYVRSASTSFSLFSAKYKNHPRFVGLTNDERESLFNEHIGNLKSRASERKRHSPVEAPKATAAKRTKDHRSPEDIKEDFFKLLDDSDVHPHSKWSNVEGKISGDRRFHAVKSHQQRRDWFEEYCRKYAKSYKAPPGRARPQTSDSFSRAYMEKVRAEKEMRSKLIDLRRKEEKEMLKILLTDLFRDHTQTMSSVMEALASHSQWNKFESLSAREKDSVIKLHFESIRDRAMQEFNLITSGLCSLDTSWEDAKSVILSDVSIKRIFAPSMGDFDHDPIEDPGLVSDIKAAYEKLQAQRVEDTKKELVQLLKDSAFIEFKVKSAIVEAHARAVEEKREPTIEDELAIMKMHEITDTIQDAPPYKKLQSIGEARDDIIYDHIHSLMDMYRDQKFGTNDRIIAEYSNDLSVPRVRLSER